jgi:hypothetical protein
MPSRKTRPENPRAKASRRGAKTQAAQRSPEVNTPSGRATSAPTQALMAKPSATPSQPAPTLPPLFCNYNNRLVLSSINGFKGYACITEGCPDKDTVFLFDEWHPSEKLLSNHKVNEEGRCWCGEREQEIKDAEGQTDLMAVMMNQIVVGCPKGHYWRKLEVPMGGVSR